MKIGITCYPTYGGSGVVATELGIELAQRGHEVHFITYAQPFRLSGPQPNVWYHEVEVSHYPLFDYPPYDLALATRMAEVAEIYALDLLHVHYAIPHSVSAYLAKQMMATSATKRRLPFVTTLHGTDITLVGQDRSYLPITRFGIERSDAVFLRNGAEYDGHKAASHLKTKLFWAGKQVQTHQDFILGVCAHSEASGKPYEIRPRNGLPRPLDKWLFERLEEFEKRVNASRDR